VTDAERESGTPALPWLPTLPWQEMTAREALAQKQRWPHALLIHGPKGLGKHALALNFAQALLCESSLPHGMACGQCPGCRYASAGQHPDLMRLELTQFDADDAQFKAVDAISIACGRSVESGHYRRRARWRSSRPQAEHRCRTWGPREPPAGTYLIRFERARPLAAHYRVALPKASRAA
jgi:hypothetical protein